MTNLIKIGITGGIGSGKTTVSKVFELLGVEVFSSDVKAKQIMLSSPVKQQIIELLGTESYIEDGSLNRIYLAGRVFNDKTLLNELNDIVHPAVLDVYLSSLDESKGLYVINEAALHVEKNTGLLDILIVVAADESVRIARVMSRDGVSKQQVLDRMNNQTSEEERLAVANYIIKNDGQTSIIDQVQKVHASILNRIGS